MKKFIIWQLDKKISHQNCKYVCMEITIQLQYIEF